VSPKQRQPLLAVTALLLPVLLVVGVWLGGHPEDLPGFARRAFVANHETLIVDQVIDRVAHDYYRPIPKSQLADASITGLVASLKDRFSHYLTAREYSSFNRPQSFTGIGVSVNAVAAGLKIAEVFNASPAQRSGLKVGELIVAVNGRGLRGVASSVAIALIKGAPDTDVRLTVQGPRGSHAGLRTVKVTRATISEPVVASTTRTVHGVEFGVVALAMFSAGAHGEVRAAVEHELHAGAKGLVFDLQGNGGGLVEEAQLIASIFIPRGVIVTTRGRTQPTQTLMAVGGAISSKIPMVVLVDGSTASASEIVTAALQDHHRATVVGTHTFGKGVFQEEEPLPNGGALDITVGEYFTPNGRNLGGGGVKQGAGVKPEVVVSKGVDTVHGLTVALDTLAAKLK
jgi:carboxyl-terminal processing protease